MRRWVAESACFAKTNLSNFPWMHGKLTWKEPQCLD